MKNILLHLGILGLLVGALMPVLSLQTANAATFGDKKDVVCSKKFLTFPNWFRGLPRKEGTCDVESPEGDAIGSFIFAIVLNIIEIGLQLVAYAAVGYIIYGGFKYLTAAGDPNRITAGRKIITNALIGLVISFMSIAIVNLVASSIK